MAAGLLDLYESTFDPDGPLAREAVALADAREGLRRCRAGRLVHDRRRRRGADRPGEAASTTGRSRRAPRSPCSTPCGCTPSPATNAGATSPPAASPRWPACWTAAAGAVRRPAGPGPPPDVPREIAVVLPPGVSAEPLVEMLRTTFVPNRALAVAAEGSELRTLIPSLEDRRPAASRRRTCASTGAASCPPATRRRCASSSPAPVPTAGSLPQRPDHRRPRLLHRRGSSNTSPWAGRMRVNGQARIFSRLAFSARLSLV